MGIAGFYANQTRRSEELESADAQLIISRSADLDAIAEARAAVCSVQSTGAIVASKPSKTTARRQTPTEDELLFAILKEDEETKEIIRKMTEGSIAWQDCLGLVMARIGAITPRKAILTSTVDTLVRGLVFPVGPDPFEHVPKHTVPPLLARTNRRRYRKLVDQFRNDPDLQTVAQQMRAGSAHFNDYIQTVYRKYPKLRDTIHVEDIASVLYDIRE